MKKQITESDLINLAKGLREYLGEAGPTYNADIQNSPAWKALQAQYDAAPAGSQARKDIAYKMQQMHLANAASSQAASPAPEPVVPANSVVKPDPAWVSKRIGPGYEGATWTKQADGKWLAKKSDGTSDRAYTPALIAELDKMWAQQKPSSSTGSTTTANTTANTPANTTANTTSGADTSPKSTARAYTNGTIGPGSSGQPVKDLQKQLGIPETGVWDKATSDKVIATQKEIGTNPDGKWGPQSRAKYDAWKATQPAATTTSTQSNTPEPSDEMRRDYERDTAQKPSATDAAPTGMQAQGDDEGNTIITRPDGSTMVVGPDGKQIPQASNPNLPQNQGVVNTVRNWFNNKGEFQKPVGYQGTTPATADVGGGGMKPAPETTPVTDGSGKPTNAVTRNESVQYDDLKRIVSLIHYR